MTESKRPDPASLQRDRDEEMNGMVFKWKKIQFYPDDLAKMETMGHKEKMDYVQWLRQENRYVEVED